MTMGLRTEPDQLFVYRDDFSNARFSSSKPAGVACTEYRKVKEHPAKSAAADVQAAPTAEKKRVPPPAKKRTAPPALNRAKSPAVKKSK